MFQKFLLISRILLLFFCFSSNLFVKETTELSIFCTLVIAFLWYHLHVLLFHIFPVDWWWGIESLCWGPQDHPQIQWFTRQTHRTQHILIVKAMISYSKKIQRKVYKGKKHTGWSLEETRHKLERALSEWIDTLLTSEQVTAHIKCHILGKLTRNSVFKVFTGSWPWRYPLPAWLSCIFPASDVDSAIF